MLSIITASLRATLQTTPLSTIAVNIAAATATTGAAAKIRPPERRSARCVSALRPADSRSEVFAARQQRPFGVCGRKAESHSRGVRVSRYRGNDLELSALNHSRKDPPQGVGDGAGGGSAVELEDRSVPCLCDLPAFATGLRSRSSAGRPGGWADAWADLWAGRGITASSVEYATEAFTGQRCGL